ncbi:MAG: TIGR00266 family protein [Polyangiaceae bacterium]|nr:TIGR00266 family protein [Myxococcales bacterium]MCC6900865.1 TIGR00266 family protein [Polyangiaceae bacterium]
MNFDIQYRPAHSLAKVSLNPGEAVVAESGAMVGMSTNVQMQTQSGGVMSGLKRMFGGESFFRNTFTAANGPGEVLLAHSLCGDMVVLEMTGAGYFIQSSSFIASTPNVNIETKVGGFKSFFAGEGVFVLQASCQGPGQVLVGAFGGIQELQCDGSLVIDTGHLVAWDATLTYTVGKSGSGWVASFLSGEGLVCHFQGQGRIWIQTRNPAGYGQAIGALLPPRSG